MYAIKYSNPSPVLSVSAPPASNIVLHAGPAEMLKITENAFYVRGVAVEQGPGEAAAVYAAFKQWMVWASLTRNS